jgi:hypothetical protein
MITTLSIRRMTLWIASYNKSPTITPFSRTD